MALHLKSDAGAEKTPIYLILFVEVSVQVSQFENLKFLTISKIYHYQV